MFINQARNVCQALPQTIEHLLGAGKLEDSRVGQVLVAPHPVVTVTQRPAERVLFSAARDANPFLHLMEAIWMLGGRSDARFLSQFVRRFGEFAEQDGEIHDAYGRRWRHMLGFDQLSAVIERLRVNPRDRQCVVQMWDAFPRGENDLLGDWRSRPCNTHLFLRRRDHKLDMTVCCRSNDMLWGAHGSNAVHFSVLLEYLAARLSCEMGLLYQLSNNAHVYEIVLNDVLSRATRLVLSENDVWQGLRDDRYSSGTARAEPMFEEPENIDADVGLFLMRAYTDESPGVDYANRWFSGVPATMLRAHRAYKRNEFREALAWASDINASDWRTATIEWIQRRAR